MAHSNRALGEIAKEYSLSLPVSRFYYNARTNTMTHTALISSDKAQVAAVYKAGVKVGVLRVPPREMIAANQLQP